MLNYDAVFVDVAAFGPSVACRFAVIKPDPIPSREAAVPPKMSKPNWEEALPLTLSRDASTADGLSVCLTGLRQCLDQHHNPGALLRCGHSGSAHRRKGGRSEHS